MTNPSDAEKHVTSHADHPALMASTETPERTPEVSEKKLVWKLDILILPLTAALYLAAFLDRGNAGNAKLQGLLTILGSNPDLKYSIVLMSFYITYIVNTSRHRDVSSLTHLLGLQRPRKHSWSNHHS